MRCQDVREIMQEYVDGDLSPRLARRVDMHLSACPGCAGACRPLRAEANLFRRYAERLDHELEVHEALWENVQSRISPAGAPARGDGGRGRRIRGVLAALLPAAPMTRQVAFAAAVAVFSVAVTLLAVRMLRQTPEGSSITVARLATPEASVPAEPPSLERALQSIRRAEQEYLQAIRILGDMVEKEKPSLDPGLLAEFERNLKVIDDNIAATRVAYYAHPSDPELAHYMLAAYSRKVELLQEVAS